MLFCVSIVVIFLYWFLDLVWCEFVVCMVYEMDGVVKILVFLLYLFLMLVFIVLKRNGWFIERVLNVCDI